MQASRNQLLNDKGIIVTDKVFVYDIPDGNDTQFDDEPLGY